MPKKKINVRIHWAISYTLIILPSDEHLQCWTTKIWHSYAVAAIKLQDWTYANTQNTIKPYSTQNTEE